ncbi:hypothetical protein [Marinobacterium weihaiense]|uniref:Uncharacterized protein n=1 Tax=Marinobacterium weihaiense TaxID=2851016 RepID=A0ABS6MEF6_9GAMM|nr:hypothetical protein [Marinobacterium weihaiense]MBV0934708.1 hypothetical protein [Marinobacterium weihaiense]
MSLRKLAVVAVLFVAFASLYFVLNRHERAFVSLLQNEIEEGRARVDLAVVFDGDWELMCFSHPYDGPLKLDKYGISYPPVADAQDGAWGFLFIKADGSYRSVSGSRSDGFEFDPDLVCIEQKDAKFQFAPDRKRWSLDTVQDS